MSVQTVHPSRHLSPRAAGLGIAGAALALAAGLTIAGAISEPTIPVAPGSNDVSQVVPPTGARDSWEGRIGPGADRKGVRDSGMPPGMTDQQAWKLDQIR